jgi:hypothetical protein
VIFKKKQERETTSVKVLRSKAAYSMSRKEVNVAGLEPLLQYSRFTLIALGWISCLP